MFQAQFTGQQGPFPIQTPAVTIEITRFPDHPVTGADQADRVGSTGGTPGTSAPRCPDGFAPSPVRGPPTPPPPPTRSPHPAPETFCGFREVVENDPETPVAMAHIFDPVRRSNIAIDEGNSGQASALSLAVMQMCSALGLELRAAAEVDAATMQRASDLDAARAAKDFATADAIRNELQAAGFVVESTKDGTRVRRA